VWAGGGWFATGRILYFFVTAVGNDALAIDTRWERRRRTSSEKTEFGFRVRKVAGSVPPDASRKTPLASTANDFFVHVDPGPGRLWTRILNRRFCTTAQWPVCGNFVGFQTTGLGIVRGQGQWLQALPHQSTTTWITGAGVHEAFIFLFPRSPFVPPWTSNTTCSNPTCCASVYIGSIRFQHVIFKEWPAGTRVNFHMELAFRSGT
jgi:hypothetical protein